MPVARCRIVAVAFILALAILRILYLGLWCPLDLAPDEAHYWDWSRQLDWSYYSKGPLVAVLIRVSYALFGDMAQSLTGAGVIAVRLPAIVCGSLILWAVFRLTAETFRNDRWALGMVVIAATMPLISAGSSLITIDSPYICAWAWALVHTQRAVTAESSGTGASTRHWIAAGLCIALGVLAKHTMVLFVPMVGLFLLVTPNLRGQLWRRGFWLMTAIGALGGIPILVWNMQHDWVTLQHTKGHAGLQAGAASIHWLGPLRYVGLQAAILLGYWFFVWAAAVWAHRPGKQSNLQIGFLWWMSVPMFVFFALFSFKNGGGEPNWPIAGYVSGLVLGVGWWAQSLTQAGPGARRFQWTLLLGFVALGLGLTAIVHDTRWLRPVLAQLAGPPSQDRPMPLRQVDPTCRLKGWQTLGREVDKVRARLRHGGVEPVIVGGTWTLPGELAFYLEDHPVVFCLGSGLGERHSQYDLWRPNPVADPARFRGKTFILVGVAPQHVEHLFERVEPLPPAIHEEGGNRIAQWMMAIGHGYRGDAPAAKSNHY